MYVEKQYGGYMEDFEGDGQMFITYYFTDSKLHVKALM
jgi:hypothetical protein